MPHRRPAKKGSFSGHFDGLVTQFAPGRRKPREATAEEKPKRQQRDQSVHEALFEAARH